MAYGCHEERYPLPIAAVDTHRPKPVKGKKEVTLEVKRHSMQRDYFGGTAPASGQASPGAVKEALQKAVDAGAVEPKVAAAATAHR
jgi:6-phosphofructo-2-kinase/fructose-2,6-biphosphatase 2